MDAKTYAKMAADVMRETAAAREIVHAVYTGQKSDAELGKALDALANVLRLLTPHDDGSQWYTNMLDDPVRGKPRPSGRGRIARTAAPSYNGVAADNQGSLRQGMPEVTPVEIRVAVAHSAQEPTEATHSGSMPG